MKLLKEEQEQEFKSQISRQDAGLSEVEDKAKEVQNPVYADAMREFDRTKKLRDEYIESNMESAKQDVSYTPKMPKNEMLKKMYLSESLFESEDSDGWDLEDFEGMQILDEISNVKYEIDSCVRGAHTNCHTFAELGHYLKDLAGELDGFAESLIYYDSTNESMDESLTESASGEENVRKLLALFKEEDEALTVESLQSIVEE